MYFVDRKKIESSLTYMEKCLQIYAEQSSWSTEVEKLGLERLIHSVIESIIDVGNSMIDGFIMRDPGSYEDIIEILQDEKVLAENEAEGIKAVVRYRKALVQSYTEMEHEQLNEVLKNQFEQLQQFPVSVRKYLEDELGPVSAFLP
ncbi:DUF86 domain-containing protein [Anaerobacillus sp. MEB173]|uniref:DUF86 domain-containing protein n=1 Tax=Anaerobacillus sp. MEB173 TaxID=3383345 RepID=UPI003F90297D